jgi:protein-S-isoprenylcysteine O-methyltransferase Ste14
MRDGGQSGSVPAAGQEDHWPTAVASLIVGLAFFSLWFWLLPQRLGFSVEMAGAANWRWLTAVPSVLGFAVALRCVWDFGWTGRGTPAPIAPPQRLFVVDLYRYVRNPMYLYNWMDWALGRLRTRQPGSNYSRSCRCHCGASVCGVL